MDQATIVIDGREAEKYGECTVAKEAMDVISRTKNQTARPLLGMAGSGEWWAAEPGLAQKIARHNQNAVEKFDPEMEIYLDGEGKSYLFRWSFAAKEDGGERRKFAFYAGTDSLSEALLWLRIQGGRLGYHIVAAEEDLVVKTVVESRVSRAAGATLGGVAAAAGLMGLGLIAMALGRKKRQK